MHLIDISNIDTRVIVVTHREQIAVLHDRALRNPWWPAVVNGVVYGV